MTVLNICQTVVFVAILIFVCWQIFPSSAWLPTFNKNLSICFDNARQQTINKSLLEYLSKNVQQGGYYSPKHFKSKDKVAIVVPFRRRLKHLVTFIGQIHKFLIRQNLEYQIFLVEQTIGKPFNRGSLLNVGFLEATKLGHWDCFIFHDIDLIPLDDRNIYNCSEQPRHLSAAIDKFKYKLPYNTIFGGASEMMSVLFVQLNGFSNSFWGWGGEDDNMFGRIASANHHITRYSLDVARYRMLNHTKAKPNPSRFEELRSGKYKYASDGLNSISYKVLKMFKFPFFTWIYVEL